MSSILEIFEQLVLQMSSIVPEDYDAMFPIIVSDTTDDCSICYEPMTQYVKTKCGHKFHKPCLRRWLFHSNFSPNKTTCPLCRKMISKMSEEEIKMKTEEIQRYLDDMENHMKTIEQNGQTIFRILMDLMDSSMSSTSSNMISTPLDFYRLYTMYVHRF